MLKGYIMNRFERTNSSGYKFILKLVPILLLLYMLFLLINGINQLDEVTLRKQQESLEIALERSISQCYSVEGRYPPDLAYITEHYGLTYNERFFLVDYDYYGSNLPPDVLVLRKELITPSVSKR